MTPDSKSPRNCVECRILMTPAVLPSDEGRDSEDFSLGSLFRGRPRS